VSQPINGKDPKNPQNVPQPNNGKQPPKAIDQIPNKGDAKGTNPVPTGNPGQNPDNGKGKNYNGKEPATTSNEGTQPLPTTSQPPPTYSNSPAPEPTHGNPNNEQPKNNNPPNNDNNNENDNNNNNNPNNKQPKNNNPSDNNDNNDDNDNNDNNNGNKDDENNENQKPFIPPPEISISLIPTPVTTTTFAIPTNIPAKIVVDEEASYDTPPPNTTQVQLKFSAQLPWLQVVKSDILPSQFVSFVREDLSKSTGIALDDITVRDLQAADDGGVLMTMNIPDNELTNFSDVVKNPKSNFYLKGSELSKLVDPTSPIIAEDQQVNGITSPTNNLKSVTGNSSNKGLIIGLAVGGSTILYAGLTALVIRAYKRSKSRTMQRQENHIYGSTNYIEHQ
ncbi:hypothetical protein C1645_817514, partial [Glomus cerebriforme]